MRLLTVVLFCLLCTPVFSTPILQLYLEGGTYNETTESWEVFDDNFTLWAIGNTSHGTIEDVRLSIAYDSIYSPFISLTPTTTGGFGGVTDPSTPSDPTLLQTVTDGSAPLLGDGSSLPTHGVYGEGTTWQEFYLGDFDLSDSPVGDYISSFPDSFPHDGQINAYDIAVFGDGLGGLSLHFDLYDHVMAGNHLNYKFAPFSHDADGGPPPVPEPASFALMGIGLGLVWYTRRRSVCSRNGCGGVTGS